MVTLSRDRPSVAQINRACLLPPLRGPDSGDLFSSVSRAKTLWYGQTDPEAPRPTTGKSLVHWRSWTSALRDAKVTELLPPALSSSCWEGVVVVAPAAAVVVVRVVVECSGVSPSTSVYIPPSSRSIHLRSAGHKEAQ